MSDVCFDWLLLERGEKDGHEKVDKMEISIVSLSNGIRERRRNKHLFSTERFMLFVMPVIRSDLNRKQNHEPQSWFR